MALFSRKDDGSEIKSNARDVVRSIARDEAENMKKDLRFEAVQKEVLELKMNKIATEVVEKDNVYEELKDLKSKNSNVRV
ncbi:hypothetical protein J2127_001140 [Methanococcus voltae]|uniref:Uncharacterized protein n=2 Tax=Methanococcus voltae TaxID=2188 RepID=A0A8J7RN34_METVO|nr:hypothetical protein [Methanococcus voltae]MBP2143971.1 hypothetical protein [Methanococcus voltae]MBP2173023.1 hypothetical protein [Methanococcus voltae]MBP2201921.1 hypothetical protein [Methanococcus voltae]MCS3922085.1 hypothetical protein [Methanococcus voltae PS]